ncbi:helix-turn-helix domain-containing protein [Pseudonocardiaceae bacterium YIM PH 21723]|nr:helix-turn-helix domain-containing protein [Pseudonocardiaceae bacterium YIM PH 21723]
MTHRVAVLALPGVYPFELGVPGRLFGAARDADGKPLYKVLTCSVDGAPVRTNADFSVTVEHDASLLRTVDTVVLPPTDTFAAITGPESVDPAVLDALAQVRPGTRVVSICTASHLLAAAGRLDGRPATTHWHEAERFRRAFPAVQLNPTVLFVDNGDLLTSAGAAAGIDLCLHLIRSDHGSKVANQVARLCVVPPHRDGGQAQYIEQVVPEPTAASTAAVRDWALENLGEPLSLDLLAQRAGMSRRTFVRRFREEVGKSPGQWLLTQRVDLARRLLENSDLTVDAIAARAGFGTGASLRRHLRAVLGVAPDGYRRTFRTRPAA